MKIELTMINPILRKIIFLLIACLNFFSCHPIHAESNSTLNVNIFSMNNGKGLQLSRQILKNALEELGHVVNEKEFNEIKKENETEADINIFFEFLCPNWFSSAKLNWFVPNPECYTQNKALLDCVDLILCRTHEVEKIFQALDKKTYFLGFSSRDCYLDSVEKSYSDCFHLAGGSSLKGTLAIIESWKKNKQMPNLLMITHNWNNLPVLNNNICSINLKIPEDELHYFQNYNGIHLCPSEAEGYGHYLMEAMSTKAVVMTTDAPPMNEFITDKRCLIPYQKTAPCQLGTRYFINPQKLAAKLKNLMALSKEELEKIGERNRSTYLQMTYDFKENLKLLMELTAQQDL